MEVLGEQKHARQLADRMFYQIEQVLEDNQKDLENIEKEYRQNCLHNAETGQIVGSSKLENVGKHLSEIGFDNRKLEKKSRSFHSVVNGTASYCVFEKMGENYIGRIVSNETLYENIPTRLVKVGVCMVLIAVILVLAVTRSMNRHVVSGYINDLLKKISSLLNAISKLEEAEKHQIEILEEGVEVPLRFSVGYEIEFNPSDYREMFRRADKKMYVNKRKRKSSVDALL